jgi:hypothetical protein
MTDKSLSNELERALARTDVETLRLHLEDYRAYLDDEAGKEPYCRQAGAEGNFLYIYDAHEDSEFALAFVMLALSEYDDPRFISMIAVGPLEDVLTLREPTTDLVERIVAEAQRTPRLRWMLKGIYLPQADWARGALQKAIVEVRHGDPLPPL